MQKFDKHIITYITESEKILFEVLATKEDLTLSKMLRKVLIEAIKNDLKVDNQKLDKEIQKLINKLD